MRQKVDQFGAESSPEPDAKRHATLKAWLAFRGIKNIELAESIDVSPAMITRILKGERRSPDKISKLIEHGIPKHLLPKPSPRGPGRPKNEGSDDFKEREP